MAVHNVALIIAACFAGLGLVFWTVGFAIGKGLRRGWIAMQGHWAQHPAQSIRTKVVEYTVAGETRHIFPVMNRISFNLSGPIAVSYDPKRPSRAVINTFYHRGGAMKVIGAALAFVGVVIAGLGGLLVLV